MPGWLRSTLDALRAAGSFTARERLRLGFSRILVTHSGYLPLQLLVIRSYATVVWHVAFRLRSHTFVSVLYSSVVAVVDSTTAAYVLRFNY